MTSGGLSSSQISSISYINQDDTKSILSDDATIIPTNNSTRSNSTAVPNSNPKFSFHIPNAPNKPPPTFERNDTNSSISNNNISTFGSKSSTVAPASSSSVQGGPGIQKSNSSTAGVNSALGMNSSPSGSIKPGGLLCAECQQPISGPVVTALKKTWHPEHFMCKGKCKRPLGTMSFFEKDASPYCDQCYHAEFSPKCAYCNETIIGVMYITILFIPFHHSLLIFPFLFFMYMYMYNTKRR